jgi:hypothetical protein
VLHEAAHLLMPSDRHHGAAFIYVLQTLYRTFLGIPEEAIRALLTQHKLPSHTILPMRDDQPAPTPKMLAA